MIIDNKDYYIVKKVDKWGVISLDKEIIIPIVFDDSLKEYVEIKRIAGMDSCFLAAKEGEYFIMDIKNKKVKKFHPIKYPPKEQALFR